jgi:transcriptional regulator with XRE-family HTH domain
MNGKELKKMIIQHGMTQEDAAKLFGVTRETVSRWCKSEKDLPIVSQKKITSKLRLQNQNISENNSGNQIQTNGDINNSSIHQDNRQYYSDSPDVLRAQIEVLDERIKEKDAQIKEKDAQIKEKDAQIKELLSIVRELSKS